LVSRFIVTRAIQVVNSNLNMQICLTCEIHKNQSKYMD
jgi:hypothetical protein